jgi:vitamin B12 transporter
MRPFLLCAAALSALILSTPARAQEAGDEIIVTVTRSPTGAVPGASSTLTEGALEQRQTPFVLDALATLPGITVAQNGGFGGVASIRVRGASASQTLVLIDGVPVGDPSSPDGAYNAANLDTASISQIEVLRGPQSTLWGSNAIGGVVSITTRPLDPGFHGRAFAEAGSFGLLRAGFGANYGGPRFEARLDASGIAADGISKADARAGNTETDGYDSTSVSGRIGFQAAPQLRLEAFGRRTESAGQFDSYSFGAIGDVADGPDRDETVSEEYGTVGRLSLWDGRLQNTLTAARSTIDRTSYGAFYTFATAGSRDIYRYQGDLKISDSVEMSFGAERENQGIEGGEDTTLDGQFLVVTAQLPNLLVLTAGVRRDDHSTFGDVTTARAGFTYAPRDWLGLSATYGQGFKAPTVYQLTSSFGALPPNAALRPEEAEGWDAALFGSLFNDRLDYDITYFNLDVRNQIDFGASSLRYENIARVETSGIEATGSLALAEGLSLEANYTKTDAVDATTGSPLTRIPEHAAYAALNWQPTPALGFTLAARFNGEEPAPVGPGNANGMLDAWTRLDVAARYTLTENLELYGRVENVTDEAYQDVLGYGTPGRSGFVGVRVRL